METPSIEDLRMVEPVTGHSGPKGLALFGAALYEFHVPGIGENKGDITDC